MNDKMKSDIERLLAEGERFAAEQRKPVIKTKPYRDKETKYWGAWPDGDPNLICYGETEAEAVGALVVNHVSRFGILLKREVT